MLTNTHGEENFPCLVLPCQRVSDNSRAGELITDEEDC